MNNAVKDTIARLRFERGNFAKMAAAKRKLATECRRRKDFMGALLADERAAEYRRSREQWDAEIKALSF
jgi:hypothetical protein